MSSETKQVTGLKVLDEGITIVNPATTMDFVGAGVTGTNPSTGKATITVPGGSGNNFSIDEVLTDNGNSTYTLAHTPIAGTVAVYKNGIRINAGSANDYTLSGTTVTRNDSYVSTDIFKADYQY